MRKKKIFKMYCLKCGEEANCIRYTLSLMRCEKGHLFFVTKEERKEIENRFSRLKWKNQN